MPCTFIILTQLIFWLVLSMSCIYDSHLVLYLWQKSFKFQVHYGGKAVVWILDQGILGRMAFIGDKINVWGPSLLLYLYDCLLFTNCRPSEASSPPSKLRRNASASANISNLVSQSTPANPGFLPKKFFLLKIPDWYVGLQESSGNSVMC